MLRTVVAALTGLTVVATAGVAGPALAAVRGAGPGALAGPRPAPVPTSAGLPDGVPAAALAQQPSLPAPQGWPFPEAFSQTSGTGRLAGGATYWTDFLYDDHGATGAKVATPVSSLAPTKGTFVYPTGPAHGNGADIFRSAVGLTSSTTYWRVDWNTLADPKVPIAEWALDADDNPATGVATWPGGAGVRSAGIDKAILVSGTGAWLIDAVTGQRTPVSALGGSLSVTTHPGSADPGSFVVRIPNSALHPSGTWRVRLASGLANATGDGFAPVPPQDGALPGQPAVYNVTFRSYLQEPEQYPPTSVPVAAAPASGIETGNYWMENDQAATLASGDVSKFSLALDWSKLAHRATTPEPQPPGYTNRWYVSSIAPGLGVVANTEDAHPGDAPDYAGRVQPYAVYVPTSYRPGTPTPLTWVLHSLGVNLNQYGALSPALLVQACQDRHSICATTEGRGPDGWYFDQAEADFWQVWHALGQAYTLDPERTVLSGYSMGGYATYKLGLAYPDLFARAVALAGGPVCGLQVEGAVKGAAGPGRCKTDGDSAPLVGNARWLPFVMADGVADELVPVTSVLAQIGRFDAAGERYRFYLYPAEDHLVYATQDQFGAQAADMGDASRVRNPAHITYTWYPDLTVAALGIGTTGAYWVRGPVARDQAPGALASFDADSQARPGPTVTIQRSHSPSSAGAPTPGILSTLTWHLGPVPAAHPVLDLHLSNVSGLTLDLARAGFPPGTSAQIPVTTDGPTAVTLAQLAPGQAVLLAGAPLTHAAPDGLATLRVAPGTHVILVKAP